MAEKDTYLAIENVEQLEQAPTTLQETPRLTSLKMGLRTMSMLVKDRDGQGYDPEVVEWLQKVKKLAYKAQDAISSIVAKYSNYQKKRSKLARLLCGGNTSKVVEELQDIEKRIEKVCSFKDVDGLNQESHHSYNSVSYNANEVVGFEDRQERLVTQIIGNTSPQLEVILVFGMLGSGKTTLAKMVYNDERIKEHFEYLKWVSFPQELSLDMLLCRILRPTSSTTDQWHHRDELKDELKGKRYLIVIDNMHKLKDGVLDELMSCFPNESMGSRILLTRRAPLVDLRLQDLLQRFSFLYEIKPLDENDSWLLLSRKVPMGQYNPELENLGKKMASKCKGSPKAILALAAILDSVVKTEEMWSKFLECPDDLFKYHYLSEELQYCLLYFALFPAGSQISAEEMIQMWIAERFVKQQDSNTAEEIGENYLNELIRNSFIKAGKRRANGSVKTCYTSSHVRHLSKAINSWMAIPNESLTEALEISRDYSHTYSLHCFSEDGSSTSIKPVNFSKILHKFHNLRVLNLSAELKLEKMPNELGKLEQLRYLKLIARNLKYLPPSFVNLSKLETVDMRYSPLLSLPEGIWKLECLRHLYLGGPTSLPKTSGIDYYRALPNLQILSGVTSNKDLKWLIVRAKFPNVTQLRIISNCSELSFKLLNSLDHLYYLQSLMIEKKTKLPDQNAFPLSLTKLTLLETELDPKCIDTLEMLPNLRILQLLTNAIRGENIECSAKGFSQLEVLCIEYLNVKSITIEEGAMQCIERCIIRGCKDMEISDYLKQKAEYLTDQEEIHDNID